MEQKKEEFKMSVSEGLKRFRKEFHLSQNDIATALGVHRQAYQRYEGGKVLPVITVLMKIADTYNVSIDYLVGRVEGTNELVYLQNHQPA